MYALKLENWVESRVHLRTNYNILNLSFLIYKTG